MIASGRLSPEVISDILAEARLGGDQSAAAMLLAALREGPFRGQRRPAWLDVRVLSGVGLHVEAIDRGLMALDTEADAHLHLALAEALLAARDPDNAAAHAEEALEEAGDSALNPVGSEALLMLALASFNNEEIESGLRACERLLAQSHSGDRRVNLILAETRALVRRFGREMVTEEV
jgi:tetratricopeptide (TPR) repeat protein